MTEDKTAWQHYAYTVDHPPMGAYNPDQSHGSEYPEWRAQVESAYQAAASPNQEAVAALFQAVREFQAEEIEAS